MRVEAIGTNHAAPYAHGATAQLAEARRTITAVHPHVSWASVVGEAHRMQKERGMTLVTALQVVFARLNSGAWQPHVGATVNL